MINISQETLFNKAVQFPDLLQQVESKFIYPRVKNLYFAKEIQECSLAGRLKQFTENWKLLTNDEILSVIEGYKLPFHDNP